MKTTISALLAVFALFGNPALADATLAPNHKAITYLESDSGRHIQLFMTNSAGELLSVHYSGTSWEWTNHGKPPGSSHLQRVAPVTYVDSEGKRRKYVFAVNADGQLWVRYHKGAGFAWAWSHQGGPKLMPQSLSATTFTDDEGVRRIFLFAIKAASDGQTPVQPVTHHWDGSSWNWLNLPNFPDTTPLGSFTVVTHYKDVNGPRRMEMFWSTPNNGLMRYLWSNNSFSLAALGNNANGTATITNYLDNAGTRHVRLFAHRSLPEAILDRDNFAAQNIAYPELSISEYLFVVSQVSYVDSHGTQRVNLYAQFGERLFRKAWQDDVWQPWVEFSGPPENPWAVMYAPEAITFADPRGGPQYIYVFVRGPLAKLCAQVWDG
jgi:hypothetical protein